MDCRIIKFSRVPRTLLGMLCLVAVLVTGCSNTNQKSGADSSGTSSEAGSSAVTVKMGDSPTDLKVISGHDFSLDALKAGQMAFSLDGDAGKSYSLQLSSEDVASLLAGSTVMTEASEAQGNATKAVSLWVQQAADEVEEDSGW